MSKRYSTAFDQWSTAAPMDLWEIVPVDERPIRIIGLILGQTSDEGDAEAEILRLQFYRSHVTSGSGGSTASTAGLNTDVASGITTVEYGNSVLATGGSPALLYSDVVHNQIGKELWFPPEAQIQLVHPEARLVVRMPDTPNDVMAWSSTLFFEEYT